MKWWEKVVQGLLGFLASIFVKITSLFFTMKYDPQKHLLPTLQGDSSELLFKPSVDLARMIRERKVKCYDLVNTFIEQIKLVNPCVNALVASRFTDALEEARCVDEILDSEDIPREYSEENKPLLGIPFTAKEAFAVTGLPNTSGLIVRKNVISESDAVPVELLRNAGAIPLGVTNCSELCMWYESSNLIYGRTANAYHMGRTVGGSSGGEGCLQSFCGAAFGLGSDIGGSIRMPAFFNGIFGHKPTTGVVINRGQFPDALNDAQTFLSTGPMCRFAVDLKPIFKVLVKKEYIERLNLDTKVDLSKLNYYYMLDDGGSVCSPVDSQIKESILKAVSHIEGSFGVPVTKASINKMRHSFNIWCTMMSTSGNESFCSLLGNSVKPVNPLYELLRWLMFCPRHTLPAIGLGIGEKIRPPSSVKEKLQSMCVALKNDFRELLGDNGVFLYPTHPVPAPYHNQPLTLIPNFAYTGIFNVLGMPSTCVPMGLSRQHVPIGFQVIGWQYNDRLTLAVAEELGRAFGGWVPPFKQ